jgi:hypothetical protein
MYLHMLPCLLPLLLLLLLLPVLLLAAKSGVADGCVAAPLALLLLLAQLCRSAAAERHKHPCWQRWRPFAQAC